MERDLQVCCLAQRTCSNIHSAALHRQGLLLTSLTMAVRPCNAMQNYGVDRHPFLTCRSPWHRPTPRAALLAPFEGNAAPVGQRGWREWGSCSPGSWSLRSGLGHSAGAALGMCLQLSVQQINRGLKSLGLLICHLSPALN